MKSKSDPETKTPRLYRVGIKNCIVKSCDGELTELAYYEKNNWVTVELQCKKCKRKFVAKIEM